MKAERERDTDRENFQLTCLPMLYPDVPYSRLFSKLAMMSRVSRGNWKENKNKIKHYRLQ
jgi:hypothetical protein